jgi:hypothetical protein
LVEQVLQVVEHEQQPLRAQVLEQLLVRRLVRGERETHRAGNRRHDPRRRIDGREGDEEDAVRKGGVPPHLSLGSRQCQTRLAHAAWANQCEQAVWRISPQRVSLDK